MKDRILNFNLLGRCLAGITFVIQGILFLVYRTELESAVPTFIGAPGFWVIVLGLCWLGTGASFLINFLTRLSGTLISIVIMLVLAMSTYRGFATAETFVPTVLSFAFGFILLGAALMVASRGQWAPFGIKADMPVSDDLYYAGRTLCGCFFFTTGWLHFAHISEDAAMLSIPGAVFWVVFVGLCWFAVAFSFWTNIMARTAGLLASLLILIITFTINIKGLAQGGNFETFHQLANNLGAIAACILVGDRGHYWLNVKSWWLPPQKWGFDIGKENLLKS